MENNTLQPSYFSQHIQRQHISDIYGNYDSELHGAKYFTNLYGELCHEYYVYGQIKLKKLIAWLTQRYNLTDNNFIVRYERGKRKNFAKINYRSTSYMVHVKDRLLMQIAGYKVVFWYGSNIAASEINEIVTFVKSIKRKHKYGGRFYMIANTNSGYDLRQYKIRSQNTDISLHYNDDFQAAHNTITDFVNNKTVGGVVLLHGKHGTGKTAYLRHLMQTIKRRFIVLPAYMIDSLASPALMPFLSQFENSVLIVEDCEDSLGQRAGGYRNTPMMNLLNMSDGLLGDALKLKIICSFNTEIKQIDKALLRRGRLAIKYEFKELETPKAQQLAENLGINQTMDKPMTLADIFHLMHDNGFVGKQTKKIGF